MKLIEFLCFLQTQYHVKVTVTAMVCFPCVCGKIVRQALGLYIGVQDVPLFVVNVSVVVFNIGEELNVFVTRNGTEMTELRLLYGHINRDDVISLVIIMYGHKCSC